MISLLSPALSGFACESCRTERQAGVCVHALMAPRGNYQHDTVTTAHLPRTTGGETLLFPDFKPERDGDLSSARNLPKVSSGNSSC